MQQFYANPNFFDGANDRRAAHKIKATIKSPRSLKPSKNNNQLGSTEPQLGARVVS